MEKNLLLSCVPDTLSFKKKLSTLFFHTYKKSSRMNKVEAINLIKFFFCSIEFSQDDVLVERKKENVFARNHKSFAETEV